jgi:hypothetical protein
VSAIPNLSEPHASGGETKDTGRRYAEAQKKQLLLLQEHQTKLSTSLLQEGICRSLAGFIIVVMSALIIVSALYVFFGYANGVHEIGILLTPISAILSAVVGYYFGQRSTVDSSHNKGGAGSDI